MNKVQLKEIVEINPRLPNNGEVAGHVSFVPMASVSDQGYLVDIQQRRYDEVSRGYTYFEEGDILVAKITPCMENGKVAVAEGLPCKVGFGSTEFHVIRPNNRLDRRYLFHLLWNPRFRFLAARNMTGSAGQKRVPVSFLVDFEIPLPTLEEQKRIAAILDKADAIRRKRAEALRLTDDFLKSVFLDMFGDPRTKRSKYSFGTVRKFATAQSGKLSSSIVSDTPSPYPIYGGNGVNGYAVRPLFTEPVIVAGRVGQQCGIIHLTKGPAWVTDNAIVVQITDKKVLHPLYLAFALQLSPIRDTVVHLDLPFINQSMLLDYPIPMPPIKDQQRFAEIHEWFKGEYAQRQEAAHEAANCLSNSLVQRAFRGEL